MEKEPTPEPSDLDLIRQGIDLADMIDGVIDDATVRRIALRIHTEDDSALRKLGMTGEIDGPALVQELGFSHQRVIAVYVAETEDKARLLEFLRWLTALLQYTAHHSFRPPVEGWNPDSAEQ